MALVGSTVKLSHNLPTGLHISAGAIGIVLAVDEYPQNKVLHLRFLDGDTMWLNVKYIVPVDDDEVAMAILGGKQ